jgi:hypothetical protein
MRPGARAFTHCYRSVPPVRAAGEREGLRGADHSASPHACRKDTFTSWFPGTITMRHGPGRTRDGVEVSSRHDEART